MLDKKHRDELHASGLNDETIERSGIYSAEGEAVREILGWRPKAANWGRGMVFRFRDAEGTNAYARFKPDYPRHDAKSGKIVKYESPQRAANRAYFTLGSSKTPWLTSC